MKLYMAVTTDEYELPLAVTDTAVELARMYGVTPKALRKIAARENQGRDGRKFVRVIIDEEVVR
jgi:hypothetical protein